MPVEDLGLDMREASEIVELFFDEIANAHAGNEPVRLSGFGNFTPREKGERPGRNPKTGEAFPIAARRVVTFRTGRRLQARMQA